MTNSKPNRALFYTRDSGGKHETTLGAYVQWAAGEARKLDLQFAGTAEHIEIMAKNQIPVIGDLFLDYDVSGHLLSRPGLDALKAACKKDPAISRLFIPLRERLARPNDPIDAMQLENFFSDCGITLHYQDRIVPPCPRGHRRDLGDAIAAYVSYDQSGRFRTDLARKVLHSKRALASAGFSTGGRARYGFRRYLVRDDGTPVRELVDGERVRMAGHHVAWLPGSEDEQKVTALILEMLPRMSATRVAAILTANGVPTPDAGRTRVDGGVRHVTRGVWNATTVTNIARNALLVGMVVFNRRGMGDQLRLGPDGIRELADSDYRGDGHPKVVIKPVAAHITSKAHFEPLIDKAEHDQLIAILDGRGASQRGKPRSRDPNRNPLGGRVFDMNCSWPMYRVPRKDSFQYTCSQYGQSDGQICDHNHVDGMAATRFVLSCIQQGFSTFSGQIEDRLRAIAKKEFAREGDRTDTVRVKNELGKVRAELVRAGQNLARADGDDQYRAVAAEFERLKGHEKSLVALLAESAAQQVSSQDLDSEVELAMQGLHRMAELAEDETNLPGITELFRQANVRLFLRFEKRTPKKRELNVLTSGVLTLGSAPSPIEVYQGPTARNRIRDASTPTGSGSASAEIVVGSGSEGKSLGNANRGDMI